MEWAVMALLLAATSCQSGKNPQTEKTATDTTEVVKTEEKVMDAAAPVEAKKLQWKDITVEAKAPGDYNVSYSLKTPYPVDGPEEQVHFLRKVICEMADENIKRYDRDGIQKVAQDFVKEKLAEVKDMMSEGEDPSAPYLSQTYEATIDIVESNDRYISIHKNSYAYTGGAHGMPFDGTTTFDLKRQKKLDWKDLFIKGYEKQLAPMVKKAVLKQHYEDTNYSDGSSMEFALPGMAPALTAKGMKFQYTAYEIDCYAAGMPSCILPYKDLMPLLTPEAKELIGK